MSEENNDLKEKIIKSEEDKEEDLIRAGLVGGAFETVQRYGSAIKEHCVAYSGIDNENAMQLKKSLNSIYNQGSNKNYEFQINQQKTGWAAEVKDTANTNAENIINGKLTRKIRHDDLPNTAANHQLFDHVQIDSEGNIISGSGTQMKFIGASAKDPTGQGNAVRALNKLQSKEFQKYIDNDIKIEVPKDEYLHMINKASDDILSLQDQLKKVQANGNLDEVAKLEKKIENLKKLKKNLQPSKLTRKEAVEAATNPKLSTIKSVGKIAHQAGKETAINLAIVGGSVSLVKNIVGIYKENVGVGEAAFNVVKDTVSSAAIGYGTGFAGSAIKGLMQNSSSEYTRVLSKTNIASTIVSVTVSAAKTIKKYCNGDIDGTQCLEELGEQGAGMIASSMYVAIGQAVIPIPVVGGLVGGMVGYAMSSAAYGVLVSSLREAKEARENRIKIEKECEEHIKMIREYRSQINNIVKEYLADTMEVFNDSFSGIKKALEIGDIDLFVQSTNAITERLGGNKPFENMPEFDRKMKNKETFKI